MVTLLVALSTLFVLGIVIASTGPTAVRTLDIARRTSRERLIVLVVGLGVAAVVLVLSGWFVPSVVVGAGAGWAALGWQRRQRTSDVEILRLEALASWIESVRDVLMAGEQPIGAITSTAASSYPAIRPHVRRLAAGLGRQDPDIVFRRFADDLDDPLADLVAAGLAIAIRRGARTVPVLSALAEQTREQVDRRRLIEAERAPMRREVQALSLIMGGLVVALLVFGRSEYLDAYDSGTGQLFLTAALGGYVALIVRVQRLGAFPRPSRFLIGDTR
jgi:Flp pilus assembly protein TadB